MNKWIRKEREKLIKLRGGKCIDCGSKENLEFAHKEPTELSGEGRGRKERIYDVKKNPDSYKLLCGDCHRGFDGEI